MKEELQTMPSEGAVLEESMDLGCEVVIGDTGEFTPQC